MSVPLHTTCIVSCQSSDQDSGPTIVNSTGVQNYRIHPDLIRVLQEAFTNSKLCDHEQGVQCNVSPQEVIEAFENVGFSVTTSSTAGDRQIWMLTKTGEGGSTTNQDTNEPDEQEEAEEED